MPRRILVQTLGSAGDVHPFLAVGAELVRRGHDVTVLGNGHFEAAARAAGVPWRTTSSEAEFLASLEDPDLWHPARGLGVVLRTGVFPDFPNAWQALDELATDDTVLVNGTLGFAARSLRDARRLPLVTLHLAPSVFRSNHRLPRFAGPSVPDGAPRFLKRLWWWLGRVVTDRWAQPGLDDLRAAVGLGPVRDVFHGWMISPDRNIALFPDWFGPPQPDWPATVRCAGFPLFAADEELAAGLVDWLQAGDPPIVFTAGSANVHAREYFSRAPDVAAALGCRALLVTRDRATLAGDLPPHVRHEAYASFARLLPRCRALVSHGGIGTTAQALAYGLPHLVAALGFDQFDNASRLRDLGVGDLLPMKRFTVRRAEAALRPLLADPGVATRAREAAARCDGPAAIASAADLIETAETA